LGRSDVGDLKKGRAELEVGCAIDHVALKAHLKEEHKPEVLVVEECFEHIQLLLGDHSAVNLVEQVHQNKSMEDHCVHLHFIGWVILSNIVLRISLVMSQLSVDQIERFLVEHHLTEVQEDDNRDRLVEHHAKDASPHGHCQDFVSSADTIGPTFISLASLEWFSTDGDGTQSVHDEVEPKELNDVEGCVAKGHATQKNNEAQSDVDSKLELDELSHVVEDGATPHDGIVDGLEIVIKDHKVGVFLGNSAS
jgi:hypothetical protein